MLRCLMVYADLFRMSNVGSLLRLRGYPCTQGKVQSGRNKSAHTQIKR